MYTHTGFGGVGWGAPQGAAVNARLEKKRESRQRRIEDTHSPLLRSLCYAVHSGLQGQLSLCKTWQNSSLGRQRQRERVSIRSNKEYFLHSSAWHHLSTLADAEWMLRTKHPSGEEMNTFGFLSTLMTSASRKCELAQQCAHTHTHACTKRGSTRAERNGKGGKRGSLFIKPRVTFEQLFIQRNTSLSYSS